MPRPRHPDLRRFLSELKRRKVVRVAIAYAVVAWITVQVSATVVPYVGLPSVVVTAIIVAVAAGFPVALVLSWAYDLQPDVHGWSPAPAAPPERSPVLDAEPQLLPATRYQLPSPAHPMVGRHGEIASVTSLLNRDRLVTIIGPGGVGKTRLALEVGLLLQGGYVHGACFIPLAGVSAVHPLVPELALRLRLPLGSTEDPRTRIIDFLREKEILLVLDNFEHLAGDTAFLLEILDAAPGVRMMVTSRQRLRLRAESLFPLDPLEVEPISGGISCAEELFLQVARRADPGYAPEGVGMAAVRRICRRLEGVPLAIELAAAWWGDLDELEIERQIESSHDFLQAGFADVPDRHRSLRAAFASSWLLLESEEKDAFARLSVFRGGFDRAAAEEVAGAPRLLLTALQEKSLLRAAPGGRYEVLELLRTYAEEKLADDPPAARTARLRHAEHFARRLSSAGGHPEGGSAMADLGVEIANLREAWLTAVRERHHALLGEMVDPLSEFYELRGWAGEGGEMFERALVSLDGLDDGEGSPPALRGALATRLGIFRYQLGRPEEALVELRRGAALAAKTGSGREEALALNGMGQLAHSEGAYEEARRCFESELAAGERAGDDLVRGRALASLGITAWMVGDNPAARRLFEEAITLLRARDALGRTTGALRTLGVVEAADGDSAAAERLFREALAIDRERGNQRGIAFALQNLAVLAHEQGRVEEAERYLDEAISLARETGNRRLLAYCSNERALLALRAGSHERARELLDTAFRVAAEIADRPLGLQVLIGYARLLAEGMQEDARAVELLSTVRRHPATDQGGKQEAATMIATLRERLDGELFEAAVRRGETEEAAGSLEALLAEGTAPTEVAL